MIEEIEFLKSLQKELKEQDNDCQAAPRFWVLRDYRMDKCSEDDAEEFHVYFSGDSHSIEINEKLKEIKENELENMSSEAIDEFNEIGCEDSAFEWIKEYYSEDVDLIPVKEVDFIVTDTMFLTKQEAKDHIKSNYYHYSSKVHTYAMTAWRSPKVEKLLNILENFDWDKIGGELYES